MHSLFVVIWYKEKSWRMQASDWVPCLPPRHSGRGSARNSCFLGVMVLPLGLGICTGVQGSFTQLEPHIPSFLSKLTVSFPCLLSLSRLTVFHVFFYLFEQADSFPYLLLSLWAIWQSVFHVFVYLFEQGDSFPCLHLSLWARWQSVFYGFFCLFEQADNFPLFCIFEQTDSFPFLLLYFWADWQPIFHFFFIIEQVDFHFCQSKLTVSSSFFLSLWVSAHLWNIFHASKWKYADILLSFPPNSVNKTQLILLFVCTCVVMHHKCIYIWWMSGGTEWDQKDVGRDKKVLLRQ